MQKVKAAEAGVKCLLGRLLHGRLIRHVFARGGHEAEEDVLAYGSPIQHWFLADQCHFSMVRCRIDGRDVDAIE
jgi:hypothetical protein